MPSQPSPKLLQPRRLHRSPGIRGGLQPTHTCNDPEACASSGVDAFHGSAHPATSTTPAGLSETIWSRSTSTRPLSSTPNRFLDVYAVLMTSLRCSSTAISALAFQSITFIISSLSYIRAFSGPTLIYDRSFRMTCSTNIPGSNVS